MTAGVGNAMWPMIKEFQNSSPKERPKKV